MMASDFIVDVTEADFEYEVIAFSTETPVVVDFWATWCSPCRTLGPLLEKLAEESQGGFRLARVDVDANPNLAQRFNVRSIPTVKAFQSGQIVAEFSGAQSEARVREFLEKLVPNTSSLALEKGLSLLELQQFAGAELAFLEVLQDEPDHPLALLGLGKALLLQGRAAEAFELLNTITSDKLFSQVQNLKPLAQQLANLKVNRPVHELEADPLEAAFENCLRLVGRGNLEAALDGLLDILRQDRRYRDGAARKMIVALLELLGEQNELTRQYRKELAMVLF
jgi:putative thioredoxin